MRKGIAAALVFTTVGLWSCGSSYEPPAPRLFSLDPIPGSVEVDEGGIVLKSPSILDDPDHFVWGGSVIKGQDGRYHMFYSIFDAGPEKPPFRDAWLLSSKIAYAVSNRPDRDFVFQKVILRGARDEGRPDAWDAQGVHNPHIKEFDGTYYLYYIGSHDPGAQPQGSPGANLRKRDRIQQVQKIGVIACKHLEDLIAGHFTRPDTPLLIPRTRVKDKDVIAPSPPGTAVKPDNLIVVNPSVVFRPADGKYLLYFKGNLYDPNWRGVHGVAVGDSPLGPFRALDEFVFDVRMPDGKIANAEDPYVWHSSRTQKFYAVIKDFSGRITQGEPGLALLISDDGIQWELPENPLFSTKQLVFKEGTTVKVAHLERPQMLIDKKGMPVAFYAACSIEPVGDKTDGTTFNVQMKIKPMELMGSDQDNYI